MTDDPQDLLARFGEGCRSFLDRSAKKQHASTIFDMRRRTVIGCYCYFDHLPWLLDVLEELTTPAELGATGRGLCGTPTAAQIHGFLWGYLIGRENELGIGRDGGSDEDLLRILRWWEGMAAAYRKDDVLLPIEAGHTQPAADPELVADVLERHGRPAEELASLGRLTSALQLYQFILGGEQRGTTYFHGPYPGPEGRTLIVEEFTEMRHNELPWNPDPPVLVCDTVAAILDLDGVDAQFDMFQGMAATPGDYLSRLRRGALVTCDDGEPRPLSDAEVESLTEHALAEQKHLFREFIQWDPSFKIAYGAYHYLDFLLPFVRAAGAGEDIAVEVRSRFAATIERRMPELTAMEAVPVWDRLYARPEPLFAGLGARASEEASAR